MLTLLGSFTNTYLPSGIFMHMSVTVRTIPQPFAKETLSWAAKSVGRIEAVLKITCRVLSRGFAREIYLRKTSIFKTRTNQKENQNMRIVGLKKHGKGEKSGHRDLPDLHELSACKDALHSPFSKFAAVVLHLRCDNSATLRIQFCPPVRRPSRSLSSRVKLIERANCY